MTLTPKQRIVYDLHLAGLSQRDISLALGVSPSTAKNLLGAARLKIESEARAASVAALYAKYRGNLVKHDAEIARLKGRS